MRIKSHYEFSDFSKLTEQLLVWGNTYPTVVVLHSNQNSFDRYANFDFVLAVSEHKHLAFDDVHQVSELLNQIEHKPDWWFGFLGYDLKASFHSLASLNHDGLLFPNALFFNPEKVIYIKNGVCTFAYQSAFEDEIQTDWDAIQNFQMPVLELPSISLKPRLSKEDYVSRVKGLQYHINRGDIYEVNFCQEFFTEKATFDALSVFRALNKKSEAPFASYLKAGDYHVMCASPERFLCKRGEKLVSQPIKGTAPRFKDFEKDKASANALQNSEKERSENVMIVDLVRNDLSVTAQKGSVTVEELCGIYGFKHVFQKISTISSLLKPYASYMEVFKSTFPMGSMTGAPKISAMLLAEKFEVTQRGLYSGSIGYFDPEGDFDFNVVIRTVLYNTQNQYVSCSVGSAITALSDAELEYEECLLKARAIREVLSGNAE